MNFVQRALAIPHFPLSSPIAALGDNRGILAITGDLGLYSSVLIAACGLGWSSDWANTHWTAGWKSASARLLRSTSSFTIRTFPGSIGAAHWIFSARRQSRRV
jgi:hypothetical protein